MSKIANAFKGGNGKAFIPFITCGDPSLEVTEQLVYAMEEAGANLIELGIPFSDPTAEGPVIQAANILRWRDHRQNFCNGRKNSEKHTNSDGFHDVYEGIREVDV